MRSQRGEEQYVSATQPKPISWVVLPLLPTLDRPTALHESARACGCVRHVNRTRSRARKHYSISVPKVIIFVRSLIASLVSIGGSINCISMLGDLEVPSPLPIGQVLSHPGIHTMPWNLAHPRPELITRDNEDYRAPCRWHAFLFTGRRTEHMLLSQQIETRSCQLFLL